MWDHPLVMSAKSFPSIARTVVVLPYTTRHQHASRAQQDPPSARYARLCHPSHPSPRSLTPLPRHRTVRITYTLPAISSEPPLLYATGFPCAARQGPSPHVTYTTTTRGLVPVFVHDVRESGSHRRKRRKIVVVNKGEEEEEEEESEGGREQKATVCLKSVVRAICLAR